MIVVLQDTQCISLLSHYCKEMTDRKQTDNGNGLSWLTVRGTINVRRNQGSRNLREFVIVYPQPESRPLTERVLSSLSPFSPDQNPNPWAGTTTVKVGLCTENLLTQTIHHRRASGLLLGESRHHQSESDISPLHQPFTHLLYDVQTLKIVEIQTDHLPSFLRNMIRWLFICPSSKSMNFSIEYIHWEMVETLIFILREC